MPQSHENYTPDFNPQAQIGVVRTGELIQYLQDTCQELALHNFPVKEYSDIRDNLRNQWNLIGIGLGNIQYLSKLPYLPDGETRIEWAKFVSNCMAELIRNEILFQIEELKNSENDPLYLSSLKHIYRYFQEKLPSKLYGFLAAINRLTSEIIEDLFDKTIWLAWKGVGLHWFRVPVENPVQLIMDSPKPYCLIGFSKRDAVTLIVPLFGLSNWRAWLPTEGGLVDQNGTPVSKSAMEVALENKDVSKIRWKSFVSNPSPELKPFVLLNIVILNEKVLIDKIYQQQLAIFKECKIARVRNEKGGYEKEQLYSYEKLYEMFDMPSILRGDDRIGGLTQRRLLRNQAREHIKRKLMSVFSTVLNSPVDLYIKTIEKIGGKVSSIPKKDFEYIRERLNNHHLADVDIDLLLLLTMELLYGAGKNSITKNIYLIEPSYYAAVFIDEVQDFTEIQVRLMSMLADPRYRAVTVVGDMGQRLHRPSVLDLKSCFMPEHWDSAHHVQLTENIRQSQVDGLKWLSSSYRARFIDQYDFTGFPNDKQGVQVHDLDVLAQPELILPFLKEIPTKAWTAVVVWPSQESAKLAANCLCDELAKGFVKTQFSNRLDLSKRFMIHQTIPQHIKGLEFDCLIMVGTEHYDLKDVIAINEVYVCLSRPTQQLIIVGQLSKIDSRFAQLLDYFRQ